MGFGPAHWDPQVSYDARQSGLVSSFDIVAFPVSEAYDMAIIELAEAVNALISSAEMAGLRRDYELISQERVVSGTASELRHAESLYRYARSLFYTPRNLFLGYISFLNRGENAPEEAPGHMRWALMNNFESLAENLNRSVAGQEPEEAAIVTRLATNAIRTVSALYLNTLSLNDLLNLRELAGALKSGTNAAAFGLLYLIEWNWIGGAPQTTALYNDLFRHIIGGNEQGSWGEKLQSYFDSVPSGGEHVNLMAALLTSILRDLVALDVQHPSDLYYLFGGPTVFKDEDYSVDFPAAVEETLALARVNSLTLLLEHEEYELVRRLMGLYSFAPAGAVDSLTHAAARLASLDQLSGVPRDLVVMAVDNMDFSYHTLVRNRQRVGALMDEAWLASQTLSEETDRSEYFEGQRQMLADEGEAVIRTMWDFQMIVGALVDPAERQPQLEAESADEYLEVLKAAKKFSPGGGGSTPSSSSAPSGEPGDFSIGGGPFPAASASAVSWDISDVDIIEAADDVWEDEVVEDFDVAEVTEDDPSIADLGWAVFSGEAVGMGVMVPF